MTEDQVVETIHRFIDGKFPKECRCCGRIFLDLADYLRNTTHLGDPVSYDAQWNDWPPVDPLGTMAMANCACGTTLSISSSGMSLSMMWRLMRWARKETVARGITVQQLLSEIREKIDRRALSGAAGAAGPAGPAGAEG